MNHTDHVNLLRTGVPAAGGVWADFGSGWGAFTLALADLLGPGGAIYSVDRNRSELAEQQRSMSVLFPVATVHYLAQDFTNPLDLPPLDGIVMANSLHFVPVGQRQRVLGLVKGYLKPGGRLLLVEYDSDHGNIWVPHPMAFPTWQKVAAAAGFAHTERLASVPSHFMGAIYSAASW